MGWTFSGCTIDDAGALAINNAGAFWGQSYWRMIWPANAQLVYITEQLSKRIAARVLLVARDERRHEKAVDEDTGDLLGYARWLLPPGLRSDRPGSEWADGLVPDVDVETRKTLEELADSAWWEPGGHKNTINTDELDARISATKERILAERRYMSESFLRVCLITYVTSC